MNWRMVEETWLKVTPRSIIFNFVEIKIETETNVVLTTRWTTFFAVVCGQITQVTYTEERKFVTPKPNRKWNETKKKIQSPFLDSVPYGLSNKEQINNEMFR